MTFCLWVILSLSSNKRDTYHVQWYSGIDVYKVDKQIYPIYSHWIWHLLLLIFLSMAKSLFKGWHESEPLLFSASFGYMDTILIFCHIYRYTFPKGREGGGPDFTFILYGQSMQTILNTPLKPHVCMPSIKVGLVLLHKK